MFIWANTSVTKPGWWARGESQIDVTSYGESNTNWAGLPSGLENKCRAFIRHIVHEHHVYTPSEVGISNSNQTWLTQEYIRRLAVSYEEVHPIPSRMTIDCWIGCLLHPYGRWSSIAVELGCINEFEPICITRLIVYFDFLRFLKIGMK